MEKKLARDEIQLAICDMFWNKGGSSCKKCPYFTEKHECTLKKDLEKVFTSAPIPPAKQWVETTHELYLKDKDVYGAFFDKYTVVADMKQKKMENAKCSEEDEFDDATGIAIAYARLRGLPVHPDYASKKDKVLGRD